MANIVGGSINMGVFGGALVGQGAPALAPTDPLLSHMAVSDVFSMQQADSWESVFNKQPAPASIFEHPLVSRDTAGSLRYAPIHDRTILRYLKSVYGKGSYADLGHGVIGIYPGGGEPPIILQPAVETLKEPVVSFAELARTVPNAKPVVFYRSNLAKTRNPFDYWMDSLRRLGYDIRVVVDLAELKNAIKIYQPDIICFSGNQNNWNDLPHAGRAGKKLMPGAITILGGYAAVPEAANAFDIVVRGEGEVVLPALLRKLQQMFADKRPDVVPIPWREKIPRLKEAELPDDIKEFANGDYYPPVLSPAEARDILKLFVTRYSAGGVFDVPIGGVLSIRSDEGILRRESPGGRKASWPIPVNGTELDVFAQPAPADAWWRWWRYSDTGVNMIYSQRGCRGEARCGFCSISAPPGRRMTPEWVAHLVDRAIWNGAWRVGFADEQFI